MPKSWIAGYENADTYNWVIELKESSEVVSSISAIKLSVREFNCEIGYCICKRFWPKGVTTEALKALVHFFFIEVGLNRIEARHDTQNIASAKVMKNVGMSLEGTLRQRMLRRDETFGDCNIWAIIREDYVL